MAEESSERKQRHFSYQDLSLDKAYIIGFSLKDNLKKLPETKERDKGNGSGYKGENRKCERQK